MTDYGKIGRSAGIFLIMYIAIIIMNYLFPPILTVIDQGTGNQDISSTTWFFIAIIWTVCALIIPTIYIYEGINSNKTNLNPIIEITCAAIFILAGILLTIKLYQINLPNILDGLAQGETFIRVLLWSGISLVWIENILIAPIWIIINAYQKQQ